MKPVPKQLAAAARAQFFLIGRALVHGSINRDIFESLGEKRGTSTIVFGTEFAHPKYVCTVLRPRGKVCMIRECRRHWLAKTVRRSMNETFVA